jgi:solute carrier family 35 (UDP-sugar transporter), member A1/2/3
MAPNATTTTSSTFFNYIPFKGWSIVTFIMALLQAGGGLLVAATLKYADAVLKTLATSGSIVLSAVIGYLLLGGTLDIFVVIGSIATILAIFNYTLDP